MHLPPFDILWKHHPTGLAGDVKALIGGKVDADWITDTCIVRISRAFNYSGDYIPGDRKGLLTVRGRDNLWYAIRVREFRDYLLWRFGKPALSRKGPVGGVARNDFIDRRGIIYFDWGGAAGGTQHMDLWNGRLVHYNDCFHKASLVELWT